MELLEACVMSIPKVFRPTDHQVKLSVDGLTCDGRLFLLRGRYTKIWAFEFTFKFLGKTM